MRPLFLAAAACLAPLAPLAPLAAAAAATSPLPSLPLVREHFEALESLRSLSADFRQAVRLDGSQTIRRTSGHLEFRSPGLLRLETVSPEAQTTVIDGSSLWVYRPSTNQVVRTPLLAWRKSQPLAGSLLDVSRYAELLKSCRARIVSVGKPGPDGYRR
ncbi:MAG: outer membrane lipoprotein carrier protein LolA, partial [Elusimicrobia bacterium]|nr:outer membrane lipoprotein carrier protein LolA [Elusimicrobiota bacterium]